MVLKRERCRYVNGPHLVALVRAGTKFENGVLIERPDQAEIKSPRDQPGDAARNS
jgi:hypothetical protein